MEMAEPQPQEDNANTDQIPLQTPDDPNYVCFKIVNQDGGEFYFRIRRMTKFGKVFSSYCERNELQKGTTRFFFDGSRVPPYVTPADINFKTGDQIEAFSYVHGGGKLVLELELEFGTSIGMT